MIRKINYLYLLIFSLLFSTVSFSQGQGLYAGFPETDKLAQSITQNPLFKHAPLPQVEDLTYESTELATNQKFSRYQIQLLSTQDYITRYHTREVDPSNTSFVLKRGDQTIRGEGVGYGGIFMLAYEKWHLTYGKPISSKDYYKKYEMTSMSNVKGKLFPLHVGNELSFNYTEQSQNQRSTNNQPDATDSGKMVYEVVGHLNGFKNTPSPVPGDIYVIRVSRTTRANPQLTPMYEYYFSTKLGWYIAAFYYRDGQRVAFYRVVAWQ